MNDIIHDTQDGLVIWQTTKPLDGKVRAVIVPVEKGCYAYGVWQFFDDYDKFIGVYKTYDDALDDAHAHAPDGGRVDITPVVVGKWP